MDLSAASAARARSREILATLLREQPEIAAVMLATGDGRAVAGVSRAGQGGEAGRFAAMLSSMAALGRTVLGELKAGRPGHILIEGDAGTLVISEVPLGRRSLILGTLAGSDARLGAVLARSKGCCIALAGALARVE